MSELLSAVEHDPSYRGLLQAVIEEPDNLTHRLVLADWLEEHDDPRGELIRLQCALAEADEQDDRRPAWQARVKQLLDGHGAAWVGELASLVQGYEVRRGFVESVRLDAGSFLAHVSRLRRLAPLRDIHLRLQRGELPRVLGHPELRHVTSLDLQASEGDLEPLGSLSEEAWPCQLRALRLRGLGSPRMRLLAQAHPLDQLEVLDLGCNGLGEEGLRLLLSEVRLPRLRRLLLPRNELGRRGLEALAASPLLAQLEAVSLEANTMGQGGMEALARSPYTGRLHTLWLGFNYLGDAPLTPLASSSTLGSLRRLYLACNRLVLGGVQALLSSPLSGQLTHLDLDYNALSPQAIRALAAAPQLGRLQVLYLRCASSLSGSLKKLLLARFGGTVCRL